MVEVVAASEDEFDAGAMEGGGELREGFHPAVDRHAVDVVRFGCVGDCRASGQGVDDALLDAGEGGWIDGVFHIPT
jgi:hypothetical protein